MKQKSPAILTGKTSRQASGAGTLSLPKGRSLLRGFSPGKITRMHTRLRKHGGLHVVAGSRPTRGANRLIIRVARPTRTGR